MIRHIRGKIAHITDSTLVIDVHGVGYLINTVTQNTEHSLDKEVLFHTHMAVRETALDLYGFLTLDELEMFTLLLGLQKIGPKSAMGIMSNADIPLLKEAVRNDDPVHLSKLSGIGKKTAEKIVAGLKDKIEDFGIHTNTGNSDTNPSTLSNTYIADTIDALIALGYPQNEARKTAQHITQEYPDLTDSKDILKRALQVLSN